MQTSSPAGLIGARSGRSQNSITSVFGLSPPEGSGGAGNGRRKGGEKAVGGRGKAVKRQWKVKGRR